MRLQPSGIGMETTYVVPDNKQMTSIQMAQSIQEISKKIHTGPYGLLTDTSDIIQGQVTVLRDCSKEQSRLRRPKGFAPVPRSQIQRRRTEILSGYEKAADAFNDLLEQRPSSRVYLRKHLSRHTLEIFSDIGRFLRSLNDDATAKNAIRRATENLWLNPFGENKNFQISEIVKTIGSSQQVEHLDLNAAYAKHAVKTTKALLDSSGTICKLLIAGGLPGADSRRTASFAAANAYLRDMLRAISQLEAARLTPEDLVIRRDNYLQHERTALRKRTDRSSADLLDAEHRMKMKNTIAPSLLNPLTQDDDVISTSDEESLECPTARLMEKAHNMPEVRRFWKKYGELSADPTATSRVWIALYDELDALDAQATAMKHQVREHITKTLYAENQGVIVPGWADGTAAPIQTDAVLFLQWYTAYLKDRDKSLFFRDVSKQLTCTLEHGLSLDLNTARNQYFFSNEIKRYVPDEHPLILKESFAEESDFATPAERIKIRPLANGSGIVVYHATPQYASPATLYGHGFVTSLSQMSQLVQQAALGFGRSSNNIVAWTELLRMRLPSLERTGNLIEDPC